MTERSRWIRLVWAGDVDALSVRPLASSLREASALDPLVLEVDLSGVTSIDSSGVRPLVDAHARLLHRLRLFDPSPAVSRLLQVLGLHEMFVVVGPITAGSRAERPPLSSSDWVTIEQAQGLLMAVHGCDASSAWRILCRHAETHDLPVHDMAGLLVAHAPGALPPTSEMVVDDVMAERARAGSPAD